MIRWYAICLSFPLPTLSRRNALAGDQHGCPTPKIGHNHAGCEVYNISQGFQVEEVRGANLDAEFTRLSQCIQLAGHTGNALLHLLLNVDLGEMRLTVHRA